MSQTPIPNDPLRALGATSARGSEPGANASKSESSAAFRALLDSLAERASDLDERSRSVGAPEELASAVEHARQSLVDAMSLGDSLLEAYRANQHREAKNTEETNR